jgi:hypothetical protein
LFAKLTGECLLWLEFFSRIHFCVMGNPAAVRSIAKPPMARLLTAVVASLATAGAFSAVLAEPVIPNLVGTWTVEGKGAVLCKVKASRCKTHHHGDFSDLKAVAQITKQQGRVFHGVFKSQYATEKFVGTIGHGNDTVRRRLDRRDRATT